MLKNNYCQLPICFAETLTEISTQNNTMSATAIFEKNKSFELSMTAISKNILRIRVSKNKWVQPDYSHVADTKGAFSWTKNENTVCVETGAFKACITCAPFSFKVLNNDDVIVYEEQIDDLDPVGIGRNRIPPLGFSVEEDNIVGMNFCAKLRWDEHFYGLGERFTEFDKRGQKVTMWNYDTLGCRDNYAYKNIPFYLSSYGYGLFVNSALAVEFNIGSQSNASVSVHTPGDCVEYYIITATSMRDILSIYTNFTGPAAMPPEWSFGLWYSTGFKGTNDQIVLNDAQIFRNKKMPCDIMHFDCFWLREDMWCDFIWDDAMYPNRIEMLKTLHDNGFKVCLWINPYVTNKSKMFDEGSANSYFIKTTNGKTYTDDLWHGLLSPCAILDFTNPNAVAWFKEKLMRTLAEGVDVLKTDFAEDIPIDSIFANGKTGAEMRNIYAALYNEVVYNAVKESRGEGLVWARSGTAGMQKFPVCWSGDPRSCFEGMAGTLRAGLSMAMSGVPFWSHDIGGFYGEVAEDVLVRWAQFGLFSSHSRLHGTTTRQPWAYSEQTEQILAKFINLRYRLMPYILRAAHECVENGLPFIRPLVLESQNDMTVKTIWDEYYFGNDIIVAPVFDADNAIRNFYLPCGEWEDLLTGKHFNSGWHSVKCPLDYLPILKKRSVDLGMLENPKQHY